MGWSVNIGSIAGTAIRIHYTFLFFLAWIFLASLFSGGLGPALNGLAFMLLLFACVLAGLASWRSLSGEDGTARRVVAVISVGCSALFALAIIFPMIAALVLPPCFQ